MPMSMRGWSDQQIELLVGRLLQVGVILAAIVVLLGGTVYLIRHGGSPTDYRTFRGAPTDLRTFWGITSKAVDFRGQGMIQLGLLLLIATPVARVALTVFAFFRQRDTIYVVVAVLVLAILLYSLFSGYFGM
jgi:uncharacterized membrane protein